jgi:SAM-dependent methyltransferase
MKDHWEKVYATKVATEVSWYRPYLDSSIRLILSNARPEEPVIDAGGGASTLVDDLLERGFTDVTLLDLSGRALDVARGRLGARAGNVRWIEADVTRYDFPESAFALWHDRAVFHFLTHAEDRARYVETLARALQAGGRVVIAAFAMDGPPKCSGLDVARYAPETLSAELGKRFRLLESFEEDHHTPSGGVQRFLYCVFEKIL